MPETSSERTHGRYGVQKLVERMVRRMPALNDHEAAWLLAAIAARTDDDPERLIGAIRARRDRQLAAQQSCYAVESEKARTGRQTRHAFAFSLETGQHETMSTVKPEKPARRPGRPWTSEAPVRTATLHTSVRAIARNWRFLTDEEAAELVAVVAKREQAKTSNTP